VKRCIDRLAAVSYLWSAWNSWWAITDLAGCDTWGVWTVCSNYHALFCTSTSHFL